MDDLPLIARKVRERREQLGLTAEAVIGRMPADARMSTSNFREIERGQRTAAAARTIRGLAAALEVSPETVRLWYSGHDTTPEPVTTPDEESRILRMVDETIAARLAPLEARLALPEERMSELDAMSTVVGCLSDEQFRLVELAVTSDERFSGVSASSR